MELTDQHTRLRRSRDFDLRTPIPHRHPIRVSHGVMGNWGRRGCVVGAGGPSLARGGSAFAREGPWRA